MEFPRGNPGKRITADAIPSSYSVALFKFVCVPCTWVGEPMGAELFMIGSQSQLYPQRSGDWAASMWPRQVRLAACPPWFYVYSDSPGRLL